MSDMTEPSSGEGTKMLAYATLEAARTAASSPDSNETDRETARLAWYAYLDTEVPGNANRYAPWTSPSIEFQCPNAECGATITADQEHVHSEDEAFIEEYKHYLDSVQSE